MVNASKDMLIKMDQLYQYCLPLKLFLVEILERKNSLNMKLSLKTIGNLVFIKKITNIIKIIKYKNNYFDKKYLFVKRN